MQPATPTPAAIRPQEAAAAEAAALRLRRLRWHARRGMLENDLVLTRFLERQGPTLSPAALDALESLLDLPDGELLDLLLGHGAPPAALDSAPLRAVLASLREA